jgi:aminomethyltransferase
MAKLALHDDHVHNGAKMVYYGGFLVPQTFSNLVAEHHAVRTAAGLFDVSHMARLRLKGKDALNFANSLITNDLFQAPLNKALYGFLCNDEGHVLDDLIAYKLSDDDILLVVNAINVHIDEQWISSKITSWDVSLTNITSQMVQLALQGPLAREVLADILNKNEPIDAPFMTFFYHPFASDQLLISVSGYTGEDGFELYGSVEMMRTLYEQLAQDRRVQLCGLGARDTLRFEAALPLYSHELSESISPFEIGLSFPIKFHKNFYGKEALLEQSKAQPKRKLVGLTLLDKGVARAEYPVYKNGENIGVITTGYWLPGYATGLAMALIESEFAVEGNEVEILIRNSTVRARIRDMMFITKKYKR